MRITVICTCYNEESILPFFLDYYTSICDEIVFFDGNSTDKTQEIIKSYIGKSKCNIELRINKSIGTVDQYQEEMLSTVLNNDRNLSLLYIRNNAWKHLFSKDLNDWILVVDADEFLYHPMGLRNKLESFKNRGVTIPSIQGFHMMSYDYPEYVDGKFLVDTIQSGFWYKEQCKHLVFDSKQIIDMNYEPGCHYCNPTGNVVCDDEPFCDQIKIMHYKYIGYHHFLNRELAKYKNLSQHNKENGFGVHYKENISMTTLDFESIKQSKNYYSNIFDATESHLDRLNTWV